MFDGKAFAAEIVETVKGYVAKEVAPLVRLNEALSARVAELEARSAPEPVHGKDGVGVQDVRFADGGVFILTLTDGKSYESPPLVGQPGKDGKDADPVEVEAAIAEHVEKAVSALPKPKDGRDGSDGKDGKDADPQAVAELVEASVQKAVASIPVPKDGRDGLDGKDGVGVAGALIDRSGELVVTLTNGETKSLGPVVGKDGADGNDGVGKDGLDGLGFEDMDERLEDDGRTIVRTYRRGEQVKEFRFRVPTVLDRGVFKDGQTYEAGDGVTWGGSFWIAQKDTGAKPDAGTGDWRLAVKRGRDGKEVVSTKPDPKKPVKV
jgi:hypothetical protein